MNLDDLLKSIREENDSKGAKIDTEKFLKRKTFTNPLKGQRYQAPGLPSAPPFVVKPSVVNIDPEKLIPENADVVSEELSDKLDELIKVIREDNKLEKESQKEDKKQLEAKKKKDREDRIEPKKETKSFVIDLKKSTGKVGGFFDKLKDFLKKVLLGALINTLYNFLTDPKNREKIAATQKFLRNYWPVVLGALAYFFTPFGKLVNFVVGTVGKFLKKLGLLVAKNPVLAAALAGAAGAAASAMAVEERREKLDKEDDDSVVTPEEFLEENQTPGLPQLLEESILQRGLGGGAGFGAFSSGGFAMGTDTVPAMLTPGEFIMSRGAVNMFGADTMMAMNKMGGGTNRPKYGKVRGYQGGGYVDFAKKMVQEHEGYNIVDGMHHAYRDNKGLPTIGYGHLITPGDGYSMSSKISQQEADKLFDKDFQFHSEHAQKIPGFKKASDQQKAALIDLTFNMGPGWHKDFPGFVKAFSAGDYETAANEIRYKDAASPNLQDSDYYKDVGPRRANPIISLIRNKGVGNAAHLKGFEKLLPVSKSESEKISTMSASDAPLASKENITKNLDPEKYLGPAFGDDASMEKLSKQQLISDRFNSIKSKLSDPIDTFIRTPLRRAFPGTPNVPTETKNFVLPPIESPKQNQSKNQTGDIPSFSVVSSNNMRDLITKDLGIGDLAGVS